MAPFGTGCCGSGSRTRRKLPPPQLQPKVKSRWSQPEVEAASRSCCRKQEASVKLTGTDVVPYCERSIECFALTGAKGTPPKPKHEVQEYSFRSGAFFGSKLNVRSSIPRLAAEVGQLGARLGGFAFERHRRHWASCAC